MQENQLTWSFDIPPKNDRSRCAPSSEILPISLVECLPKLRIGGLRQWEKLRRLSDGYYCGLRPQAINHQTLSPEVRLPQDSGRFGQGYGMFGSRPPGPSADPESDPDIFHALPGRCALPGPVRSAALVARMQLLLLIGRVARLGSAREPERAAPENAESDAAQQSTSRGGAL